METTAQIVPVRDVTYGQFKKFLDSLDEERKSWSLDLQNHKNDKEFYENKNTGYTIICVYGEEIIGLCGCYCDPNLPEMVEVSFVVKKEYQSQGIGTTLLNRLEWDQKKHYGTKYITAKHFKDNIASHKAFLKAGYEELIYDDDTFDWKIKEIE